MLSRRMVLPALALAFGGALAGCDNGVERNARRVRELRDEAITHIGWIAGNLRGQPDVPKFRTDPVLPGGEDYDVFVNLALSDFSEKPAERAANRELYLEWVERGASEPFDEAKIRYLAKRVDKLRDELLAAFRELMKSYG